MLAVIGLQVSFSSVSDIDAFDYHLYRNKPILLNTDNQLSQLVGSALIQISGVIKGCHLAFNEVHLIVVDDKHQTNVQGESFYQVLFDELNLAFASYSHAVDLNNALIKAEALSSQCNDDSPLVEDEVPNQSTEATLILSADVEHLDGVASLLVRQQTENNVQNTRKLKERAPFIHHSYANIDASSFANLTTTFVNEHITGFLSCRDLSIEDIETVITDIDKRNDWLTAYENETINELTNYSSKTATTLMTALTVIDTTNRQFNCMLKLVASILCLDQRYRLGSECELTKHDTSHAIAGRWKASPYYYLKHSTSFLPTKKSKARNIIVSHYNKDSHQLICLSEADNGVLSSLNKDNECYVDNDAKSVSNGFLAQQSLKPVIISANSVVELLALLKAQLVFTGDKVPPSSFLSYCEQQYQSSKVFDGNEYYTAVIVASTYEQLTVQIKLAITGIPSAIEKNVVWKTPVGSYFSGKLIKKERTEVSSRLPISFVYPGIGSLYVGMGKDLLRLFPDCYAYIETITDDLSASLQDHLITPRLQSEPDFEQSMHLEKILRNELANIAEAGVSYACLLTDIFQKQLNLTATSAAGYSMGEVSMFAAQGCWQNPTVLSRKIRSSNIFTEQLSGPLLRLKSAWGISKQDTNNVSRDSENELLWESFHIKAGVIQVDALLEQFPLVYITIINTYESLVIAGEPSQCKALAKQLGLRAIALNVHNIIHCSLAKSEYENMKHLYSLPVTQSRKCKLFSSSCYLPVPVSEKSIAVSIAKCLTERVNFPRLVDALNTSGETVFIEMGAGKSLGTWIERILKNRSEKIICLSANQKNSDDYSAILKTIAPLISLGYPINLQSFFSGSLIRPVNRKTELVSVL